MVMLICNMGFLGWMCTCEVIKITETVVECKVIKVRLMIARASLSLPVCLLGVTYGRVLSVPCNSLALAEFNSGKD